MRYRAFGVDLDECMYCGAHHCPLYNHLYPVFGTFRDPNPKSNEYFYIYYNSLKIEFFDSNVLIAKYDGINGEVENYFNYDMINNVTMYSNTERLMINNAIVDMFHHLYPAHPDSMFYEHHTVVYV